MSVSGAKGRGLIDLGVNIDHVATLREARGEGQPSVVDAVKMVQRSGANNITMHLREDRRHIQDQDVWDIKENTSLPINFEMACTDEMMGIAKRLKPKWVTFVPEKREERTTEGGLDILRSSEALKEACTSLLDLGIEPIVFIEPDVTLFDCAKDIGVAGLEFHTGHLMEAHVRSKLEPDNRVIKESTSMYCHVTKEAKNRQFSVHLGHGLSASNLPSLFPLEHVDSVQIGHSIVSRALFLGLAEAIEEIRVLLKMNASMIQNHSE